MISSQSLSGIGKRFQIGDTAGSGAYVCCRCGEYVAILTGPEDQIPPCENCGSESGVEYVACDAEAEVSHGVDNPR